MLLAEKMVFNEMFRNLARFIFDFQMNIEEGTPQHQMALCDEQADVKILVVGDRSVGKTSIIMTLLYDSFCEAVPAQCDPVLIPPEISPDGASTSIVDYSTRVHSEQELVSMIHRCNVICVVYSVKDTSSIDRVKSYWLPFIQQTLGGPDHNRSVLLAANKSDRENETAHIDGMIPLMNDYLEIETVVECSAKIAKNISEIFYYAQKAVVYPLRPLFSVEEKKLSMKCQRGLARIFKICDANNDGLLSDEELKEFQMLSFGVPLTSAAIEEVKQVISEYEPSMIIGNALTLEGFLYLHQMFIQRGRHETVWTVLKRFGYDLDLKLRQEYLIPKIKIPKGCSTEPSPICLQFLTKLFRRYDENADDCLAPGELQSLFSVCPTSPSEDLVHSVEMNALGWTTYGGFLNLWALSFALELSVALERLAYLGFNVEHGSQLAAVTVTRSRKLDIAERKTQRKVFKCHVIGPKGAGKTVFCRSFIGKNIQDVWRLSRRQLNPYVMNSVCVKSEYRHLLLHEVDVLSQNELLSDQEKQADVVCLLYDSTNADSFAYCANIFLRHFYRMKTPCLFVATKCVGGAHELEQNYEYQPVDFCRMHQLPKPVHFRDTDLANSTAEVFTTLATLAIYPHLKSIFYIKDANTFSTIVATGALAAITFFLVYKGLSR